MPTLLEGLYPAPWTVADAAGQPALDAVAAQARWLRDAGVDGLMVLGSTGEFPFFDAAAREAVLETVAAAVPGLPMVANVSDVNPRTARRLAHHARAAGAAAVALLPPWFYAVPAEDLVEFFVTAAGDCGLPVLLYNFPERTGHRLDAATVEAVAGRLPVVAVKQSGADFAHHRALAEAGARRGFHVVTAADTRVAEAFALGARGVISGLANALPEDVLAVVRAAQRGDAATAGQARLDEVARRIGPLGFPLDIAAAMTARGRDPGPPKRALSAGTRRRCDETAAGLGELFRGWGLA